MGSLHNVVGDLGEHGLTSYAECVEEAEILLANTGPSTPSTRHARGGFVRS